MTRPEAIIFDVGYVIEGPLDQAAFLADRQALADEHGFQTGLDLWYHIYDSDAWQQCKRGKIGQEAFWDDRLRALGVVNTAAQQAFRQRLFRNWGVRPAMADLLDDLRPSYRLAILSNTAYPDLEDFLSQEYGLAGFDVVISSAKEGLVKPEAAIYQLTLERLKLPAEATLFIDDLARNTRAAEALGIPSIVFESVEALRAELVKRGVL